MGMWPFTSDAEPQQKKKGFSLSQQRPAALCKVALCANTRGRQGFVQKNSTFLKTYQLRTFLHATIIPGKGQT